MCLDEYKRSKIDDKGMLPLGIHDSIESRLHRLSQKDEKSFLDKPMYEFTKRDVERLNRLGININKKDINRIKEIRCILDKEDERFDNVIEPKDAVEDTRQNCLCSHDSLMARLIRLRNK